jgi:hypothetical protein
MRYLLIICSLATTLTWLTPSFAADDKTCTPVPIKQVGNDIVLLINPPPKTSLVYFLNNRSEKSIFVDHPTNRSAGAGWSSYLRSGNWSAIALSKSNFTIHCSTIEPEKVIPLDCSKLLSVCTPNKPTIKSPFKGSYWLVEDKSWESFVKALEGRGVKFAHPEIAKED